ncbi:hypothetical protein SRABI128_02001 [Microbacterium sp. Bi128]|nr:hypothetical protein SRABI128_02001 [Microbacterium sp. Bi128]
MLSVPSVDTSPAEPPEPAPPVVAFSEVLSPIPETALPPMVTGRLIGAITWLPPPRLSDPSVPTSPEPPEAAPPVVAASSVWLSPITETALPPMVTGTEIGRTAWLPPSKLSEPSVSTSPEPPEAAPPPPTAPPVVPASSLWLSPTTDTALPPMLTGTEIGTTAWLPPPRLSVPSVSTSAAGAASSAGAGAGAGAEVSASSVWLSPTTDTALPPTVTGTSIETMPWLPEPMPSPPSVVTSGAGCDAGTEVVASEEWLSPRSDTALPPRVTGRSTEMIAWSPERRSSVPDVSAACAMPVPTTTKPPPISAPRMARE